MNIRPYSHALGAIVLFLITLSVYGAWYAYVEKTSAVAAGLVNEIATKKESGARIQDAKNQLERATSDGAAVEAYFVDTDDVVPFLESLQGIGERLGSEVTVESVSAQPAKPHTVLQLALRITGTFDSVERTLGAIEYQPYETVLTNVTFDTPQAGGEVAPIWTAAVTLKIGTTEVTGVATTTPKKS
jgi:hypothetical protein